MLEKLCVENKVGKGGREGGREGGTEGILVGRVTITVSPLPFFIPFSLDS
jgi:hypothetical protein